MCRGYDKHPFWLDQSTTGTRSRQTQNTFKLHPWDKELSTRHMQENSPFADRVMVNGMLSPLHMLPDECQEIVRQAEAEGKGISFRVGGAFMRRAEGETFAAWPTRRRNTF